MSRTYDDESVDTTKFGGFEMKENEYNESKFLDKYIENDELREEELILDTLKVFTLIAVKEKKIQNKLENIEDGRILDLVIEYYKKREKLVDEYIKKIDLLEKTKGQE